MTTTTAIKPKPSSLTDAPRPPERVSDPFSVCFVGGNSSYRSAGLVVVAPMGAVAKDSNALQSAKFPVVSKEAASLWVLGSDNRIYPYLKDKADFTCCWDLVGPVQNKVRVCLSQPVSGATSQSWTFNSTNYSITCAAASGYFLDNDEKPQPEGNINLWKPSDGQNPNELWSLQLAPESIPSQSPGQLRFSPPVTLLFGTADVPRSYGMKLNLPAEIKAIEQCTVVLNQNTAPGGIQCWVFGSDLRIYPYVGSEPNTAYCLDLNPYYPSRPENGTPLVLNFVSAGRSKQEWIWDSNSGAITNNGAPGFFVDLSDGSINPGSKIQIWKLSSPNRNEIWIPGVVLNKMHPTG